MERWIEKVQFGKYGGKGLDRGRLWVGEVAIEGE